MPVDEKEKEIVFLRDQNEQLRMQVSILQKHANKSARSPRYTIKERHHVIKVSAVLPDPTTGGDRVLRHCTVNIVPMAAQN